ncbi:hypothetical protein pdam_00021807 [Pocillopora damicornis]|uniref:Band 7 domain-containing protein n=1 Tax=Pocillopora damicornis TaxID=46731 RepID=A0A3M6UNM7_POCDA|nr:flotillin-2-like [Pocillopora damicornis]XP_058973267.1 flotillin-2-like [Pocillopora verrucosa]RMX55231.1 hypothetical protein pdam_00021807 [Pocillopora damicornis]
MGNCHMASEREAVVVSGGCCIPRTQQHKAVAGKRSCLWAWAGLSKVDRLTLDVLTFKKVYRNVKTARSDRASVSIIAEVQIMQDLQHFARASDYFLGKTTDEISDVVLHVFEAHLRDICEQLILKRIEEDANHLSVKVRKAAIPDVWDLGVLIHDFFITDVTREDF